MTRPTWNYRIVRTLSDRSSYSLHEVHYDKDGQPWAMTEDPICFSGGSPEETIKALEMALADAKKHPVFEEPETWPGKEPRA